MKTCTLYKGYVHYYAPFFTSIIMLMFICQSSNAQTSPKYNVLFIAIDDMNERCSILDYPSVLTPNLQRLASHGMVFKNAYCQYTLCNPSRTSIMTGWRPDKTQVFDNDTKPRTKIGDTVKLLPEYFHQYGYRTERYGKIMHGQFEDDCQWDYATSAHDDDDKSGKNNFTESNNTPGASWWINDVPDSMTYNGGNALLLLERMRQPVTQPFFFGLGFATHNAFTPSLKYWNMFGDPSVQELLPINKDGKKTNLKGNGSANIPLPLTPSADRSDVPDAAFPDPPIILSNEDWQRAIHAYYGEVANMDAQLGLILDEMDRQNLWSNTVVVFWSDHGQHLGEHESMWLKDDLFHESIRVPLIICAPGREAGACNRMVELVDLYPTLNELCDMPFKAGLEGMSIVPLLDSPGFIWKEAAFTQVKRNNTITGRSLQTLQYHYNDWGIKGAELYKIDSDPFEYTNLANNLAYSTQLTRMRNMLTMGWQGLITPVYRTKKFYKDSDHDGYGNINDFIYRYAQPAGYVTNSSDCNDSNATVFPGAAEICDGLDNNCNGQVDENAITAYIIILNNPVNLCEGKSVVLNADIKPGLSYKWTESGLIIKGQIKSSITVSTAGSYQVIETLNNTCRDTSDIIMVNVIEKPQAKITTSGSADICATGNVLLSAGIAKTVTYQWQKDNLIIPGATSKNYTATVPGSYTVTVKNANDCSNTSKPFIAINSCGSFSSSKTNNNINTTNMNQPLVYPNPSKGNVRVSFNTDNSGKITIILSDACGKKVYALNDYAEKGINIISLYFPRLSSGLYFLEISNGITTVKSKVLIQQ